MKIFLIGGTGLVGSYLLPRLVERGDDVTALSRSSEKAEKINQMGAKALVGDIRNPGSFAGRLTESPEIIILLAMPNVKPGKRINKRRKNELRNETNDFFTNSMDLATEYGIPIILPGGTSFRTGNDEIADESWPVRRAGLTEIGSDTDAMVDHAIKTGKPGIIQLMFGKIYGNGGMFRFMYDMIEKGHSRIVGKGDNYIPNIHADDAALAIIKAIEKLPLGEKFIIADNTPVTHKDFTSYMAGLMNKRMKGHIPGLIVKIALGKDFYEIIRMNCIVSNAKAKRILDWQPQYPSYKEGLKEVILEMKEKRNYFD